MQLEALSALLTFERYIDLKSVRALAADLEANPPRGLDRPVNNGWLYHLLANPVYVGMVRHKEELFDGVHDPLIDRDLYNEAQRVRTQQRRQQVAKARQQGQHLLTGLVFDETGDRFTPTHSSRNRKRSGYYISARLGKQRKDDADPNGWRLPANELERAVEQELLRILSSQDVLLAGLPDRAVANDVVNLLSAAKKAFNRYGEAKREERRLLLARTFRSITVEPGKLSFTVYPAALAAHLLGSPAPTTDPAEPDLYHTERPFHLRRRGVETKIVLTGDHPEIRAPEPSLVSLIVRAHIYLRELTDGSSKTIREVGSDQKVAASEVSRTLPLAFLDPMITKAILDGAQPPNLTVDSLTRLTDLPMAWPD